MTMMITKFNKLIANKAIWIGFTFLIVVAFAFMGLSGSGNDDPAMNQAMGTLFGRPVSFDEFQSARRLTYLGMILAMNEQIEEEELQDATWRRLATAKKAEQLGIQTTDREIVEAIRNFPDFQHEGQFNPQIYQSFLQQYLAAMGFSPGEFERYVRQELAIQKLQRMVIESVLLAPTEIDRAISTIGDEFTVQYAMIGRGDLGEGLEVTEQDARAYFEENQEAFRIPPHVRVNFVRFSIDEFEGIVEITEEQAMDYYERNIERFEEVQTDDGDEVDAEFQIAEARPFEEVREEIIDQLKRERAANEAAHEATDFVISLVPDRAGNAPTFAETAEKFGVEIETVEPFSRSQIPEGIDAGFAFTRAAFSLRLHPEHYFSDAVLGVDYVYVIALEEEIDSRLPEFEEVADEALAAARADQQDRALSELADLFRDILIETLEEGGSFADAAEALSLTPGEPVTFTAQSGLEEVRYGRDLVRTVLTYNTGEVPEPIFVRTGYLVALVQERTPADPMVYAEFRPQIVSALTGERGRLLFRDWEEQLLREANFTPRDFDRSDRDGDWGSADRD